MVDDSVDRRDFLRGAAATLAALLSERGLTAARVRQQDGATAFSGPPVRVGVVGLGPWGREIVATLTRLTHVQVVGVCDSYPAALRRGAQAAPGAQAVADPAALLGLPQLEAVVVATPSHQHHDLVVAALDAGKHVYCETPLATTVPDARTIAAAAARHPKLVFQPGLQGRANPLWAHVGAFVTSGVLGEAALVKAQSNRRESWRRAAPSPEREQAVNWRLARATSAGIPGELGVHQFDLVSRYIGEQPVALTGSGGIMAWRDGREVPDTVQITLEYRSGVRAFYTATLASSFGGTHTLFHGTSGTLVVRDTRAWLVKEIDAAPLGWEAHARTEPVQDETGIALVADATKLLAEGKEPGTQPPIEPEKSALELAFEHFASSVRHGGPPVVGAAEGLAATIVAIKAHEATLSGGRLGLTPDLFAPP